MNAYAFWTKSELVKRITTLESANARLTAELSALRAEKAELDSGMHEMGAKITALVKAGDAMADKLNSFGTDAYDAEWGSAVSLPAGSRRSPSCSEKANSWLPPTERHVMHLHGLGLTP